MATAQPSNNVNSLDACDPRRNATVSASAGSGKTWLLVTRIVRLLIDGSEPGQIVALTFTRKAAGEMQIRLNQRLYDMAVADQDSLRSELEMIGCKVTDARLAMAAGLYEKMMHCIYPIRIQTFHSFCQDILARFPLEADIPPGFELLEDTSLVRLQAWQLLFDEANRNDVNRDKAQQDKSQGGHVADELAGNMDIIMLACNGPDNTRSALNSFLDQRNDWLAYTGDPARAAELAAARLAEALDIQPTGTSSVSQTGVDMPVATVLSGFFDSGRVDELKVFANLLRELKTKTSDGHADNIDSALGLLAGNENDEDILREQFELIAACFLTGKGTPLSRGREYSASLEKKLGAENAARFVELHNETATRILNIKEQLKRLQCLQFNTAWYAVGNRYLQIFQRLKREMRTLDFNDLEWICYCLLREADNTHWVQYKVDQRISHILIDEFQDTNPTQWQLLLPLLEEIAASPEDRTRSVFLVGDEKQSIYSFRRANPALQAQASGWLADNMGAIAAPLDNSRRSSPAIIDCVNRVFEQDAVGAHMTNFITHGTYLETLPGSVGICQLFSIDEADAEQDTAETGGETPAFRNSLLQPRQVDTLTARHIEAAHIAYQVRQLCDGDHFIVDKEKGCQRPIEYGDIYLLMRHKRHMAIYEQALQEQGIPFISSKKGGLLDALEIQDICSLLEILVLPFSNLSFAQVLKSPIFSVTDEDLIMLAGNHSNPYWYERLQHLAGSEDTELPPALQRAAKLLPRWQQLAEHLPVHDCLDHIFHEGDIIARYRAACPADIRDRVAENCRLMLSLSLEVDSGRYPGITHYLQRLRHLKNDAESPPEEALIQSEQTRLRILTIHASKGLEAPVVFIADCNSPPRADRAYQSLVDWPADNDRPEHFQLKLPAGKTDSITGQLQQQKSKEQWREELNLLYVAITRARQHLYITGCSHNTRASTWYQLIDDALQDYPSAPTGDGYRCRQHVFEGKVDHYASHPGEQDMATASTPTTGSLPEQVLPEQLYRAFEPDSLDIPAQHRLLAPSLIDNQDEAFGKPSELVTLDASEENQQYSNSEYARWRGVTIHRVLEKLCRMAQYPASQKHLAGFRQQLEQEASDRTPGYTTEIESCIDEALATYNEQELSAVFSSTGIDNSYNELPVMYRDGDTAVYGIIDRVIMHSDHILIVDYKSHYFDDAVDLKVTAERFRRQLEYYRQGVERLWPGIRTGIGIVFTRKRRLVML